MASLSIYSNYEGCFVSLQVGIQLYQEFSPLSSATTQAAILVPLIQSVLQQANYPNITEIITPRGPGSFTSLRVTLATAQGLTAAFPLARVLAPLNFEVMAYTAKQTIGESVVLPPKLLSSRVSTTILTLIDSKRGDFYGKTYNTNADDLFLDSGTLCLTTKDLSDFASKTKNLKIIADFSLREKIGPEFDCHNLLPSKNYANFATNQLHLSKLPIFRQKWQQEEPYRTLKPYYLHQPCYKKQQKSLPTPLNPAC